MRTLLVVLLLCCCAACGPVVAPTPSPVPAPSPTPFYQEGTGTGVTPPFVLSAGVYRVTYAATSLTGDPCFFGGFFLSADPALQQLYDLGPITVTVPLSASLLTSPLPAAPYYLDVSTTCQWIVRVSPSPP